MRSLGLAGFGTAKRVNPPATGAEAAPEEEEEAAAADSEPTLRIAAARRPPSPLGPIRSSLLEYLLEPGSEARRAQTWVLAAK